MHRPSPSRASSRLAFISGVLANLSEQIAAGFASVARRIEFQELQAAFRRLQRQENRFAIRWRRHSTYQVHGLNGNRAVMRRLRQIEAGSLTVANGLVQA